MTRPGSDGARDMPSQSLGVVEHVTYEQEQRACRTILRNASSGEDALELMAILGIVPDLAYQWSLRISAP